jgi:heme exporter protein D
MMETDRQLLAWLMVAASIAVVILVVCWIALPFAVLGTKPLLRELLREQRRTNDLLAALTTGKELAPWKGISTKGADRTYPPSPGAPVRFAGSANLPPV